MKKVFWLGLWVLTLTANSYDQQEPKPLKEDSFNEILQKGMNSDSIGGQTGNPPPPPPYP
ncbi:MAG: hypothetical protein ACK4FS_09605 [Flavobacterium sp.]